jgi:hypothetical protein
VLLLPPGHFCCCCCRTCCACADAVCSTGLNVQQWRGATCIAWLHDACVVGVHRVGTWADILALLFVAKTPITVGYELRATRCQRLGRALMLALRGLAIACAFAAIMATGGAAASCGCVIHP